LGESKGAGKVEEEREGWAPHLFHPTVTTA